MYIPTFQGIKDYLLKNWKPGDIVMTLGSGDINKQQMIFLGLKKHPEGMLF